MLLTAKQSLQPPVITLKFCSLCVEMLVCGCMHMCYMKVNMRNLFQ